MTVAELMDDTIERAKAVSAGIDEMQAQNARLKELLSQMVEGAEEGSIDYEAVAEAKAYLEAAS